MSPRSCLFCRADLDFSSDPIGDTVCVKKERKELIVSRTYDDLILEDHLKSVFILKKLLDISEEKCTEYLGNYGGDCDGGGHHPGDWFSLCSKCNENVEECYQIWREMIRWTRRLDKKKELIKKEIERSSERKWEDDLCENLSDLFDLGTKNGDGNSFEGMNIDLMPVFTVQELIPKTEDPSSRKVYRCKLCVASYNTLRRLSAHKKIHGRPKESTVPCDKCGWLFGSQSQFKHKSRHEKDCLAPSKIFQCSSCPAVYSSKKRYENHLLLHTDKDLKETKTCVKCGWVTSRGYMKRHMRRHNQKDFGGVPVSKPGRKCGKGLKKKTTEQRTPRSELDDKEEVPYYCDHCHLIFTRRLEVSRHVRMSHKKVPLLECESCPQTKLETHQLLEMHKKLVHKRHGGWNVMEETFLEGNDGDCLHCSETFSTKRKMDYHVAKCHWKEQLTCPICKEFKAKEFNILKVHMRNVHSKNTASNSSKSSKEKRKFTDKLPDIEERSSDIPEIDHENLSPTPASPPSYPPSPAENEPEEEDCLSDPNCNPDKDNQEEDEQVAEKEEIKKIKRRPAAKKEKVMKVKRRPDTKKEGKNWDPSKRTIMEEIPYYCDHCHLIFPDTKSLLTHFNLAHRKYTPMLECDLCPQTKFESKQLLRIHRKIVHDVEEEEQDDKEGASLEEGAELQCDHCSEAFTSKIKKDYHIAKFHWKTQLTCPICKEYKTNEFNKLRNHMEIHEASFTTICEICSRPIRKKSLKGHMQLFHYKELDLEPIQCSECDQLFGSKGQLKSHMNFVHLQNVASCCPLCPKKFKWKRDLELHIKTHDEGPQKHKYKKGPFICQICEAKFNVRQGLYYHMKKLHSDKYLYRCDKCGKGYCSENTLLEHSQNCKEMNN